MELTEIIESRYVRRGILLLVPNEVTLDTFSREICWQREGPYRLEGVVITDLKIRDFAMLGMRISVDEHTSSLRSLIESSMEVGREGTTFATNTFLGLVERTVEC